MFIVLEGLLCDFTKYVAQPQARLTQGCFNGHKISGTVSYCNFWQGQENMDAENPTGDGGDKSKENF